MKLIKALGRKLAQLKEMVTDEKGYRYNKALYSITDSMVLAEQDNNTELLGKYVNEFNILHAGGYEAWKSYKKSNK